MLQITDLTFRIEGKPILERASAVVPSGHKIGLVGRNGAGKTTLLRLIAGEVSPDDGEIGLARGARVGWVQQEAPGGDDTLVDWVLAADTERARLLSEAETASDPHRIADIQLRLVDIGAHAAPARAAQILSGLGFDEAAQARPCREYSGGWRMRVALASVLFLEPEVLLLDEPTNYLDLEGTLWLESYLADYPHTVVIVSHDRDLLNRAVGAILHLERGKLTLYAGGYDDFEETRRARIDQELKQKKRQDEERRRIQAFVDRFKAKASKARQAQSRMKVLAKMRPIAATVEDRVAPFMLPTPPKKLASPIVRFEKAAVGYDPAVPVLRGLDLRIDQDDRIALLGQNGNGKSTFAKLVTGKLRPMAGAMWLAPKLEVGYFAQHQLDELDPERTPYGHIAALMPTATEAEKRTRLGTWGFSADKADTRCRNLSGGEKARLLFGIAAFRAPHLMVLDEPTNHLDVDSREALVHALAEYEGAVILISHDRHLVEASADRLWIVGGGTVKVYDGDMESYRADLLGARGAKARQRREHAEAGGSGVEVIKSDRAEQRREAAERRAQLAPLRKVMQAAEAEVARLTAEVARLDVRLADPALYADAGKAQEVTQERGRHAKRLGEAEARWLAAAEAHEAAVADT